MAAPPAAPGAAPPAAAAPTPVKVGQYHLLQTLGTGSFGKVKRQSLFLLSAESFSLVVGT